MKVVKTNKAPREFATGNAASWSEIRADEILMSPAPLGLASSVSPYLAKVTGHGIVKDLLVKMVHDGNTISVRLEWYNEYPRDQLIDLDSFADASAIMFAKKQSSSAISMGAPGDAVNAWLWKADEIEPFDVTAEGYSTSQRRKASISSLTVFQYHEKKRRVVVLQRPLKVEEKSCISFSAGDKCKVAFAVWAGSNNERSGQKSISGEFVSLTIA